MVFFFSVYSIHECLLLSSYHACRVQVLLEPPCSELRDVCERPWFLKKMHSPGDDLQGFLTVELGIGYLIQVDHRGIEAHRQ